MPSLYLLWSVQFPKSRFPGCKKSHIILMVSVIKGICLLSIYALNWNLIERQKTIVNKTALFQNKTLKRRGCTLSPTSNNLLLEIYLRWHIFSQIYFYSFIQKKGHWVLYSYRKFGRDLKICKTWLQFCNRISLS